MKKLYMLLAAVLLISGVAIAHAIVAEKAVVTDPELYISLGDFLMKNGKEEYAVSVYEKALKLDPENTHALNNLGFYYKDKNPLLAEDYFKKAIELDPDYENARNNLALLYNINGNYEGAIEQLKKLVELNPQNIHYNYDLAINLAHSFRYKTSSYEELTESINYFKKVYGMQADFMYVFDNLKVLTEIKRTLDNA